MTYDFPKALKIMKEIPENVFLLRDAGVWIRIYNGNFQIYDMRKNKWYNCQLSLANIEDVWELLEDDEDE